MIDSCRVLLITSKRLGGTIFATPAIADLACQRPGVQIDCVAMSATSAEVLANNPAIGDVHRADETPLATSFARYGQVLGSTAAELSGVTPVASPSSSSSRRTRATRRIRSRRSSRAGSGTRRRRPAAISCFRRTTTASGSGDCSAQREPGPDV